MWVEIKTTCPNCGSPLIEDTSTGDTVCTSCRWENGYPDEVVTPTK